MVGSAATWASISLAGCTGLFGEDEDEDEGTPTFVVTDEVIAGSTGIPDGASGFVSAGRPQRAFVPGMEVIFKVGVWDPETGDIVSDQALDSVRVDLDLGQEVNLLFDRSAREWTGGWSIPEDVEIGTVGYEVVVSNAAEFTNVGVAESTFDIIEYQPAANYVVTDDTYALDDRGGGWVQSCLPQHNFTPDMGVGFDIGIYDGATGEPIGPDIVDEARIEFEAGDPDSAELEWDDEEELWTYSWRGIPEDYEGTLEYEIQVTNDREFHQVGVFQGSIEIIQTPAEPGEPHYVVTDDTYAVDDYADGFVQSCLPQHNFTPDMGVGFTIGIYAATTGEPVGPDVVDEVLLSFEAGDPDTVELEWDDEDLDWSFTWRGIPEDYRGRLTYEVQVSNDGEFHRVGVFQGSIQVIDPPE